tara:strand:+ start:273 stop:800 length:528 start_codon:yes stop_codon:yes gene_type:complete
MAIDKTKPKAIFIIGRPSSGKSTLSSILVKKINNKAFSSIGRAVLVDADHLSEFSLMPEKGKFDLSARTKRALHLVKIVSWLQYTGVLPIVAAIGQPSDVRDNWKKKIKGYFEIYLEANIDSCKKRDYKGTYLLDNVIGKDLPFEEPINSNLSFQSELMNPEEIATYILDYLKIK